MKAGEPGAGARTFINEEGTPVEAAGGRNGELEMTAPYAWTEALTADEYEAVEKRLQENVEASSEATQAASRPPVPAYFGANALRRKLAMSGRRGR